MQKPIWRAAIVGCGKIAGLKDRPREHGVVTTHAQAYHRHPGFAMAAVVSQPLADAWRFQEIWSVPQVYASIGEMLAQEYLDVVSICTPNEFHFLQAQEILLGPNRPKVLFIEKPVCLKATELHELLEISRQTGVAVLVNHTRRFDPAHLQSAELIQSGQLGLLLMGRGVYYGGWMHNGVHFIDTLRMLMNAEPVIVSASPGKAPSGKPGDQNLDVHLALGQAPVAVESFDEAYYQLFEMELRFERGRLRFLDFGSRIYLEQVQINEIGERELVPMSGSPLQGLDSPLSAAMQAIDAELRGHSRLKELGVDLASASGTMNLIWRARELAAAQA
ncbi:MAG: Gfo/Idh/MocA family protein [Thermodesulfobacteriota bacterium]